ncbi:phytoene desaturase family protein [Dictyobacter formicarum]|uniref:Dehydrogenase n=1 Tax=Dictyobacter formicarum TaxID=2778368 RepID=A0ABQ3VS35_9CHLR|nr:NAD(P)/FAD-dependent oxidoreductase [Dictyobacter formicarum]GHO88687.1 dehydrogenase [Dictyobacter formicarum]
MSEEELQQADVVIVGGGLAGLSAACYLAREGADVRLYEKAAELGGRASTTDYDGFHLNRGVHALYTGGAMEEVLRELAIPYSGHSPTAVYMLREGKLYEFPRGVQSLLKTQLLGFGDKVELGRLFAQLPGLKAQEFARVSVRDWVLQVARRPRVREFLLMFACTNVYSSALELVSAEVLITKLQLLLKHPVLYIDGGWQTLVEGLRQAAVRAGAYVINNCRVEAVEYEDGRVRGVRLSNGQRVRAQAVVIATTPQEALKLVDAGTYAPLQNIVKDLLPARVACLDVALRRLPDPTHPVVQDAGSPCFLTAQSLYAKVAPTGGAVIHTFKQLDPVHPGDPQKDERELEALLDAVQPGWRELVVKRVFLPHMMAIGMLPTAAGGYDGRPSGYAGRPGPQVPGIEHLLLAGDWIGPGFLADASLGSARQVARLLLQDGRLARKGAKMGML